MDTSKPRTIYLLAHGSQTPQESRDNARKNRKRVIASSWGHCMVCGFRDLTMGSFLHVHHIVPTSKGGHGGRSNLVAICSNCHTAVHQFGDRKFRFDGRYLHLTDFDEQVEIIKQFGFEQLPAERMALLASQNAYFDGKAIHRYSPIETTATVKPFP